MPEFQEPNVTVLSVGDSFTWTHESTRAGCDFVSKEGTVVQVFDNRVQVDVSTGDESNYYEISSIGKVVSISDNFNRSLVGYCVHK